MRPVGAPRTVHDVRSARSLQGRAGRGDEQDAYARLGQLAREKQRLLAEQELWQRKLQRTIKRLTEIASQMELLGRRVPPARQEQMPRPSRRPPQEIEYPHQPRKRRGGLDDVEREASHAPGG